MAQIEKLIPHILLWENGIKTLPGETLRQTYERTKAKGVIKKKTDRGGATLAGVTLGTFQDWRVSKGKPKPTEADLAKLGYEEWLEILKSLFWNRCKGDQIRNQSVANMFVDWCWLNGPQAIRDAQTAFSLAADGIVGPKTLSALNSTPAKTVFDRLKYARERSYYKIVANRPSQAVNLKGWLNRLEAIRFEG